MINDLNTRTLQAAITNVILGKNEIFFVICFRKLNASMFVICKLSSNNNSAVNEFRISFVAQMLFIALAKNSLQRSES